MDAPTSTAGCRRASRTFLLVASLAISGPLLTSCDQNSGENPRQAEGLRADVDESKRRISALQNSLSAKDAELLVSTQALETARNGVTDLEQALKERSAQLKEAQTELDTLKKKDAFVFAEILNTQNQGSTSLAIARFQKFTTDFPKSPLVLHANYAISQLKGVQEEPATATATSRVIAKVDPSKRDKEFVKSFNEGYMTLQELAPFLKKKTLAQVIALCGRPNQSYNEGTEIGYADRAINPVTGARGILIVSFDAGVVATLRVEYGGRKMTP